MWVFPLAAGCVSAWFAWLLARRWRAAGGPHLSAWGIALAMFATASIATAGGLVVGWSSGWFKTYYLFGAILNVPVLALGTIYLLAPRRVAHAAAGVVVLASAFACWSVAGADLSSAGLAVEGIPRGSEVVDDEVVALARVYSYAGFAVVVTGALASAVRQFRSGTPRLRRLAHANLLIAAGATINAAAGGFAHFGVGSVFAVGLLAGVSVMFYGFSKTAGARRPV